MKTLTQAIIAVLILYLPVLQKLSDSPFRWTENQRTQIVNAFFYGHCISQLPSGILVHRFGSKLMLGIGMVINTILGFLTPITASYGFIYLFILRFIQGIVIVCIQLIVLTYL